jgi:hypothetical protein
MALLRVAAALAGVALLAATAHVTILSTGGYRTPHAVLTLAISAGVGVGALCIGVAWEARRRSLAVGIALALIAGEAFGLIATADRLVAAREASQAPLRAIGAERAVAAERAESARLALARAPTTSSRLEAALTAKGIADTAAVQKAAEIGCRENCRKLLQAQVDAAALEAQQARVALDRERQALAELLAAAQRAYVDIKAPASPTPLADRTGIAPWVLDLAVAALGSIAANGLGCSLLAFAAHRHRQDAEHKPIDQVVVDPSQDGRPLREHAARFAVERFEPSDGFTPLIDIHRQYGPWCTASGESPRPPNQIAAAMAELFRNTRIRIAEVDGQLVAVGVALRPPVAALPAQSIAVRTSAR